MTVESRQCEFVVTVGNLGKGDILIHVECLVVELNHQGRLLSIVVTEVVTGCSVPTLDRVDTVFLEIRILNQSGVVERVGCACRTLGQGKTYSNILAACYQSGSLGCCHRTAITNGLLHLLDKSFCLGLNCLVCRLEDGLAQRIYHIVEFGEHSLRLGDRIAQSHNLYESIEHHLAISLFKSVSGIFNNTVNLVAHLGTHRLVDRRVKRIGGCLEYGLDNFSLESLVNQLEVVPYSPVAACRSITLYTYAHIIALLCHKTESLALIFAIGKHNGSVLHVIGKPVHISVVVLCLIGSGISCRVEVICIGHLLIIKVLYRCGAAIEVYRNGGCNITLSLKVFCPCSVI